MMKKPNQQAGNDIPVNNAQYGGTILGFILGLGAGLGIAFVIAFYLSKNTPQERPGVRAPNLPMTIKPEAWTAPACTASMWKCIMHVRMIYSRRHSCRQSPACRASACPRKPPRRWRCGHPHTPHPAQRQCDGRMVGAMAAILVNVSPPHGVGGSIR